LKPPGKTITETGSRCCAVAGAGLSTTANASIASVAIPAMRPSKLSLMASPLLRRALRQRIAVGAAWERGQNGGVRRLRRDACGRAGRCPHPGRAKDGKPRFRQRERPKAVETPMAITLNHTIVPARDKEAAARFFAHIFGLRFDGASGHFAPVHVNATLTLLFDQGAGFESHHYAFHVDDTEFDAILARVREAGLVHGSAPWSLDDGKLNDWNGGRGVYFKDPDGHVLELMTVPQ
jgi:catechol 2,3-dioxygenase-like lactoylglutathione lyase family enzyme